MVHINVTVWAVSPQLHTPTPRPRAVLSGGAGEVAGETVTLEWSILNHALDKVQTGFRGGHASGVTARLSMMTRPSEPGGALEAAGGL